MRFAGLVSLLVGSLLLAGCGSEGPRQAGARVAVEEFISGEQYDRERTTCTGNPSPWFIEKETDVFNCLARRRSGGCDRYRATLKNSGWEVVLERQNVDCVLPF